MTHASIIYQRPSSTTIHSLIFLPLSETSPFSATIRLVCDCVIMASSTAYSAQTVADIVGTIAASTEAVIEQRPGAREHVLALSYRLASALETPSETIQRIGWAEVRYCP